MSEETYIRRVNIRQIGNVEQSGADWTPLFQKLNNLDVALSLLARLIRFGRNVLPSWVHGSEIEAPAANTSLVSHTVSSGKSGYIYGFIITAGEANDFLLRWTSEGAAKSLRIVFGGSGTVCYTDNIPLNEGLPADEGTIIEIVNVNAGGAGIVYQALLLIGEV